MTDVLTQAMTMVQETLSGEGSERVQLIQQQLRDRAAQKTLVYGVPLMPFNGRPTVLHLQKHLLDAIMFTAKGLLEAQSDFERIRHEAASVYLCNTLALTLYTEEEINGFSGRGACDEDETTPEPRPRADTSEGP